MSKNIQTTERLLHTDIVNNYLFSRSIFAYHSVVDFVDDSMTVLELGTGSGYGINLVASKCKKFITIDKFESDILQLPENVEFKKINIPPLKEFESNSFDVVFAFQLIEHIEDDIFLVEEIHRVLKDGGKFIVTTPNRIMSLTRNPWHIREYLAIELERLLSKKFKTVSTKGVFARNKAWDYYLENKKSVKKLTRFDIFNLQYKLPSKLLQIPYDILNILNRRLIRKNNQTLSDSITVDDFFIDDVKEDCLDFFYVATK